jgi:hypothetical protein
MRYEVRLEAQDGSGHFRITRLYAADADEARRRCEQDEYLRAGFALSAQQQAELCERYEVKSIDELPQPAALDASPEEKESFRELETPDRARLHAHYQERPYKVVSVEEV